MYNGTIMTMNYLSAGALRDQSDSELAGTVERLRSQVAESEGKLLQLQSDLEVDRTILAQALEVAAGRAGLRDAGHEAKWRALLDGQSKASDRFDALELALREFVHDRKPLLRTSWRVRVDNRQTILMVLAPASRPMGELLYSALLALVPVLVNESNPDVEEQAAILELM